MGEKEPIKSRKSEGQEIQVGFGLAKEETFFLRYKGKVNTESDSEKDGKKFGAL